MTLDKLLDLCVEWQTLLRLNDWDIEVRQVPFDELEDGRAGGCVEFLDVKRKAVLRLLDPRYQRQKTLVPYDEEYTLVHELVHIHLRAWPGNDDGATEAEEIAVHRISEALLKLKRGLSDFHAERFTAAGVQEHLVLVDGNGLARR